MIRVGAVNIDTSHPMGFGEVMEKEQRARYVGVYNDSFRGEDEVNGFIRRFGLEKRCETLDELADMCDIGFIHGCDWDDHLRCAMPFIARGKPVFIDKPIVGRLSDVRRVEELSRGGARILGASSLRYAYELQDFLAQPEEERGKIMHVYGTAGVDEYNYGVHIIEGIGGLLGTGAQWVRYLGRGDSGDGKYTESHYVQFASGASASYTLCTGLWQPFVITITTTRGIHYFRVDSGKLYAALVGEICSYMEGKPNLMAPVSELTESVRVALAAAASRARGGEAVRLSDLTENDPAYDGRAFQKGYAAAAGPMYAKL